jgi:hypothetical protein
MSRPPSPFADERIMSISRNEFQTSVAMLGDHRITPAGNPVFDLDNGRVEIQFSPLPAKTLGGLLALPQASIILVFEDVQPAGRAAFIRRFDIAFQRGGG